MPIQANSYHEFLAHHVHRFGYDSTGRLSNAGDLSVIQDLGYSMWLFDSELPRGRNPKILLSS